jgi:predicted RNA binding protein YcfA (HicA-like mRNA interferase family)
VNPSKLLAKARNNPSDVRFTELLALAEAIGYRFERTRGSHRIYVHPAVPLHLNLQPGKDGKAKAYQVRRLLDDIDEFGLRLED